MVDKKAPAADWPVITGDYIVGDPESPVAVATLASHIEAELSGAAIAGPCKTENLGIEKVVANVISNPNIRFFILAGAEVQGHITGQQVKVSKHYMKTVQMQIKRKSLVQQGQSLLLKIYLLRVLKDSRNNWRLLI